MRVRVVFVIVLSVSGLLSSLGVAPAQQTPSFEAASVKRNTSGERSLNSPRFQGTTLTAVNVPLEMLITVAYGIPSSDLMDAPTWVYLDMTGGERYDVVAKACEGRMGAGQSQYKGADWSILLQVVSQALRQERVVDRTGLSGLFDFELTYNPQALATDAGDSGVDIFGAVRQQLGLKLEPGRAPFEIAVIEAVRRPTPD